MRRKVTAITLACVFALAGSSYAAPGGANQQPGKSDCKGHIDDVPGANGLCK
jgi:hypothetical protein